MPCRQPLGGEIPELRAGLREVFERSSKIVQTPHFRLSAF